MRIIITLIIILVFVACLEGNDPNKIAIVDMFQQGIETDMKQAETEAGTEAGAEAGMIDTSPYPMEPTDAGGDIFSAIKKLATSWLIASLSACSDTPPVRSTWSIRQSSAFILNRNEEGW